VAVDDVSPASLTAVTVYSPESSSVRSHSVNVYTPSAVDDILTLSLSFKFSPSRHLHAGKEIKVSKTNIYTVVTFDQLVACLWMYYLFIYLFIYLSTQIHTVRNSREQNSVKVSFILAILLTVINNVYLLTPDALLFFSKFK